MWKYSAYIPNSWQDASPHKWSKSGWLKWLICDFRSCLLSYRCRISPKQESTFLLQKQERRDSAWQKQLVWAVASSNTANLCPLQFVLWTSLAFLALFTQQTSLLALHQTKEPFSFSGVLLHKFYILCKPYKQ